jgi:hypothetical protein
MEYEVTPTSIEPGMRWLTLRVKNVGSETLTGLDARLNSLDAYSISVYGTGSYISVLSPGEEHIIPFQVSANTTTSLYATLDGWQKGELFHWESPATIVNVGQEVAELVSLFAITEPYPPTQTVIRCEATVRSLTPSEGLNLEMWANTPSGAFNELAIVETKALGAQETARYTAEFTAEEEGTYTIYAYLYDGVRRIGRRTEHLYVT